MTEACRVQLLTPELEPAYAAFVSAQASGLLYASLPFRDLLCSYLACTPRYLVALNACKQIVGVLPAMRSAGATPVLNSLPYYGSNGGVLALDGVPHARQALLDAFHRTAVCDGCVAATIITSPHEQGLALYEQDAYFSLRDERIGLLTPLPVGAPDIESALLSSFSEPRPRNIRRAIKAGVQVSESSDIDDYRYLHATHEQNIGAIGGRSKEWRFFDDAVRAIPASMRRLYVARIDGVRVAALLLFYSNETVEYFTPATDEAHRTEQPLSLLIFRAMADAAAAGYRIWNWGGTWLTQGGVYDFKRRWGTIERRYFYYTRVLDERVLQETPEALLAAHPHFFVVPFAALAARHSNTVAVV